MFTLISFFKLVFEANATLKEKFKQKKCQGKTISQLKTQLLKLDRNFPFFYVPYFQKMKCFDVVTFLFSEEYKTKTRKLTKEISNKNERILQTQKELTKSKLKLKQQTESFLVCLEEKNRMDMELFEVIFFMRLTKIDIVATSILF